MNNYTAILTIAGSDSGGCAGIQADIKSISACGGFAASAITATTAQNTQGVFAIHPIPVSHLAEQLDAVFNDIQFNAVKIGMLHSAEVIDCVQQKLNQYQAQNIVLDPVMVATSGDKLITDTAIARLQQLLPETQLITPNLPEAEVLLGQKIDADNQQLAASSIGKLFNTSVLLKGGHQQGEQLTDVLYHSAENKCYCYQSPRINTQHTHGTGCSLSSAVATYLGLGYELTAAVERATNFVHRAIASGARKTLGKGNGPIDHFHTQSSVGN